MLYTKTILVLALLLICLPMNAMAHQGKSSKGGDMSQKVTIKRLLTDNNYQPLLTGPPESVGMESGRVVKLPGQKGSIHSTKTYEEVLIVLKGKGKVSIEGKDYPLKKDDIIYIPPHHTHQVVNDSKRKLEYIYVAAPAPRRN